MTTPKLLQEFIKTEHHQADMAKARPPPELTKNTGRPAGIVYQKNEAFLDVVVLREREREIDGGKPRTHWWTTGKSEPARQPEWHAAQVGD